jgi:hypothetical protein
MDGEEADAIGINNISHLDKQHINLENQLQSLFFTLYAHIPYIYSQPIYFKLL